MYKKAALSMLSVFALLFSLSACGTDTQENDKESVSEQSFVYEDNSYGVSDDENFSYDENFIDENLPTDYYIAYTVKSGTPDDLTTSDMIAARKDGKVYLSTNGEETLFVPTEGGYLCYTRSGGTGSFESMGDAYVMDENTVSTYLTAYTNLFGYYTNYADTDGFEADGIETVAGRNCRKFVYDPSLLGIVYDYKIEFYIDKETGVCLKTYYEVKAGSDSGIYDFNCTAFKTDNITLPDYE